MLNLTLASISLAAPSWFGPADVVLPQTFPGNPWDATENDVRVRFVGPQGEAAERLAFFDGQKWRVRLVAPRPGTYQGEVYRNGEKASGGKIQAVLANQLKKGFVRKGGAWGFQYDDGTLYWPLGFNLGWQSGGKVPDLTQSLADIGANGGNWSRIWACHWDGKNPWWPNDGSVKLEIGQFWTPALDRWDALVDAALKAGVSFQFVLFHHGQFTTHTNPNWNENPWNVANGGFLEKPNGFFTDSKAKRLAKNWLRYAVARYGHSPSVLAWELFNEVEWVNSIVDKQQADVAAWHEEMTEYVRGLDPYHHLVTTSSDMSLPIYKKADYYQPHGYPPSVASLLLAAPKPKDKPLFFGEVGPGDFSGPRAVQARAIRDGIWAGLFAQHSGAGQYWTWDYVYRDDLLDEFKKSSKILHDSGVLAAKGLTQIQPEMNAGSGGDLALRPGGGWEPTTQFQFQLPKDEASMGRFSSYFQGMAHPEMRKEPVRFVFRATKAGTVDVAVSGASASGGNLIIRVNGKAVATKEFPGGEGTRGTLTASFPAGQTTVELDNDGADWVRIQSITFKGVGPNATAIGIGNDSLLVLRVMNLAKRTVTAKPSGLPLADGAVSLQTTDLDSGKTTTVDRRIVKGSLTEGFSVAGADNIVVIRWK